MSIRSELEAWFDTDLGRTLLAAVLHRLGTLLPTLFGYHVLQLGLFRDKPLLLASRISHQIVTNIDTSRVTRGEHALLCAPDALPIAADSVDVMLLPFVLEFEANPHEVLREAERVLIAEGHVVIVGFNPVSCWGVWRMLSSWRDVTPWNGRFLRLGRLKDWLTLLGFEVTHVSRIFYRPPVRSPRMLRNLGFLEVLGRKLYPARRQLRHRCTQAAAARHSHPHAGSVRRQLIATSLVKPTAYEFQT
ncbi:MAG: methyltransferase domain-containing protein [Gammaproteobacteria bacterium]